MKSKSTSLLFVITAVLIYFMSSCKKDHNDNGQSNLPGITVSNLSAQDFGTVNVGQTSSSRNLQFSATNLSADITITSTANYLVSLNNTDFTSSLNITAASVGNNATVYIRFAPAEVGVKTGVIKFESPGATSVEIQTTGIGGNLRNFTTFASENLAFGTGLSQSAEHQYNLPTDVSAVNKINMYIKLRCPAGGCGAWDVYAHIQIKDPSSGDWYELGRYITPYGVDNHAVNRGFQIDVTDFKSLLQGTVTLRAFTEVWTANGWLLSVDFDYIEGAAPDYPYSAIAKVVQYNDNSLGGVIYGENASAFDLTKTVTIPPNAEATSLRTIITGWGQETPSVGGGTCAEWCFRTHHIQINGTNTFEHYMGPLNCAGNPVQPQSGTWPYDRAGWCPGMAVPVRTDQFSSNMAGQTFSFDYSFEPWTNNGLSGNPTPHAYYAISTYVVVKSNTPIVKPTVID